MRSSKNFQRALSLLMTMAMTSSLAAPALAVETGTGLLDAVETSVVETTGDKTVRVEDNAEGVVWSGEWGEWPYDPANNATTHFCTEPGASVTLKFTGTGIAIYGKRAYNGPLTNVSVDGGEVKVVDFYGDQNKGNEQKVVEFQNLPEGEHTLKLVITDRHNESAQPGGGKYQAEINYFVVTDDPQEGFTVNGLVRSESGPIEGAEIRVAGRTAVTDGEGKFVFADKNGLPNGKYTATVSKEGFASAAVEIEVNGAAVALEPIVLKEMAGVTGTILGAGEQPVADASVTISKEGFTKTAYTDEQGVFSMKGVPAGVYEAVVKGDFHYNSGKLPLTVGENGQAELNAALTPMETEVLSTAAMDVTVAKDFPTALKYDMKGELAGKTMFGQTRSVKNIYINNAVWAEVGKVTSTRSGENAMKYEIPVTAKDSSKQIDVQAVIHTELRAEGNVLTFTITGVDYPRNDRLTNPVEQIYFFDQSLASVRSSQKDARLATATLAHSTISGGDTFVDVNGDFDTNKFNGKATRYAFLSNSELSAGVFSNSDVGSANSAGSDNNRVVTTSVDRGAYKNVGANSNQWYYDRKISSVDPGNAADVENLLSAEQKVVGIREGRDQQPYVKVVITGEENNDGIVNWQDAAIAAREGRVVHIPVHSEKVAEAITTRIAMNFQSENTNPFLTSLDNVKRVALHTDGLGQSVLLKGYASEGHDSGHPDYYDVGERMGGVKDFKTMLHEGHKYGAQFGIHVNASEFYPEADTFSNDTIRWNGSRAKGAPRIQYGWNWLDQGIAMNGIYDLARDGRYNRFKQLHDLVGDNSSGGDGLDYIYVDVWGNNTSGSENAWHTRKLSNDITAGGNNWRIVHEWAFANDWESTFQHWVSDYAYGDYGYKGKLNSAIMRFMLNSYKDSWVPDFPTYGGAANAPLLGGPVMQGFEGWQSDYEYDLFIDTLYNEMLPTKFLQHYDIMKWVDNDEAVTLPYGKSAYKMSWNTTSQWTPEVQIELERDGDKVVVTRGSDGEINETYTYPQNDADARREYRSRHITLNGRTVLVGASNPGDFQPGKSVDGDLRYLLPWYWDQDGKVVGSAYEKLYHYNIKGGETTWELPEGWENLENVLVYKLTDLGRTEETKVAVKDGTVTLDAEAEIPYIVVKGTEGAKAPVVEWTAEGQHLSDVSFNGVLTDHWAVTGSAEIVKTSHELPMLKLTGASSVSQKLTDLEAGQKYTAYVGVDNKSDAKAMLQILDSKGNVVASQYTARSFAPNIIGSNAHQNTKADPSCFQNMFVFFTPEQEEEYTLVLSHEAGEGYAHFDDVRVAERGIFNAGKNGDDKMNEVVEIKDHYTYDKDGSFVKFEQDFEHQAQGLYPFVGASPWVTDGRTHLAKKHAPYTQAGWDAKKADDVLDGNWSVKINGLVGYGSLMYTTIPQNFHFEPNQFYTVEFDYQMGSEGTYEAVILDGGVYAQNVVKRYKLEKSLGETAHITMLVRGSESGQTGVGIWSTDRGAQIPGGAHGDFGGYKDFMLDNLVIKPAGEVVQIEVSDTMLNRGEMADVQITTNVENGGVDHWDNTNNKVAVVDGDKIKAIGGGTTTLTATLTNGETKSFDIVVTAEANMSTAGSMTANTQEAVGEGAGNGRAEHAADGNPQTYWTAEWYNDLFVVSKDNPAVLNVDFGGDLAINGLMFQQRVGSANGLIEEFTYTLMDADKKVLKTEKVTVPADKVANSAILEIPCELVGVHYAEISITKGVGGFAALSEFAVLQHAAFTDKAELKDAAVGTDESVVMKPVTAPGEQVMGAVWTSADEKIAKVSADGVVTGIMEGETTITLSNAFGELASAQVTVTVSETTGTQAAQVVAEIDAIGEVTLDAQLKIAMARGHYDNLSAAAKALVTNLDKLEAAEAALDALMNVSFPDVKEGQWFYQGVIHSTQHGYFKGMPDGTFAPDSEVTRATLVQVLYAYAGKPEVVKTDRFTDVKSGDWFSDAVAWAIDRGITDGVSADRFAPNAIITRQEMALMLYAFAGKPEVEGKTEFADNGEIAPWAAEAVEWAVSNDLMAGVPGNQFAPTATATRGQIAVIMMKLDQPDK